MQKVTLDNTRELDIFYNEHRKIALSVETVPHRTFEKWTTCCRL